MFQHARIASAVRAALEPSADAVAIFTAEEELVGSEIVFVNDAFVGMTGIAAEELIGHSALLLVGSRPTLEDVRASVGVRATDPYVAAATRWRRDGSSYAVTLRIVRLGDEAGDTTHYALVQREIAGEGESALRGGGRAGAVDRALFDDEDARSKAIDLSEIENHVVRAVCERLRRHDSSDPELLEERGQLDDRGRMRGQGPHPFEGDPRRVRRRRAAPARRRPWAPSGR